jgi:UDP-2,4-diacetamido-2,4,6-trideoxy-beta-L-altropyranose hydrolase
MGSVDVLFRADAGKQIGLGHVQRCLSLAAALKRLGASSLFLTNPNVGIKERINRFGFEWASLETESWEKEDLIYTQQIAFERGVVVVVVDSDYEGGDYLQTLRNAGLVVCAIEDFVPHAFPCHLVINGDVHGAELYYESPYEETRFLLGPRYSLLRPEFWDVEERINSTEVKNLLVILGGSDPLGLMPKMLELLNSIQRDFTVSAVVGPFADNEEQVQETARKAKRKIDLIFGPDSILNLMQRADLAISGGGQTLYELARVGCPTIAIRIAANQDGQLRTFEREGFIHTIGYDNEAETVMGLNEAVCRLLNDAGTRKKMGEKGQQLIDGQGALRIAKEIKALIPDGQSLS